MTYLAFYCQTMKNKPDDFVDNGKDSSVCVYVNMETKKVFIVTDQAENETDLATKFDKANQLDRNYGSDPDNHHFLDYMNTSEIMSGSINKEGALVSMMLFKDKTLFEHCDFLQAAALVRGIRQTM